MPSIENMVESGTFLEVKTGSLCFVELLDHTPFCMFVS